MVVSCSHACAVSGFTSWADGPMGGSSAVEVAKNHRVQNCSTLHCTAAHQPISQKPRCAAAACHYHPWHKAHETAGFEVHACKWYPVGKVTLPVRNGCMQDHLSRMIDTRGDNKVASECQQAGGERARAEGVTVCQAGQPPVSAGAVPVPHPALCRSMWASSSGI